LDYKANLNTINNSFLIAVVKGNERIIKLLLEYGADVSIKDEYGRTVLIHAILNGYTNIADQLLKRGADINIKDHYEKTPLLYAIEKVYAMIVKLLIENNVDVNIKDQVGNTPLMYAIESGDVRIVELMLNYQQEIDFNLENDYGETLLSCAERIGRKKIIKLVKLKMRITLESQQHEPFIIPIKSIDERFWEFLSQDDVNEMDSLLEEKGIDINTLVNSRDASGDTALMVCSRNGYNKVMTSLLECNADISFTNNEGDTALIIASDKGNLEAVRLLLNNIESDEMKSLLSYKDSHGNNSLIRATMNDHFDVVEELIYRKSVINAQGENKRTSLMIAAEKGFIRLVKLLIKKNAKINITDSFNKTAYDIVNNKIGKLNKSKNKYVKSTEYYKNIIKIKDILEIKFGITPIDLTK